MAEQSNKNYMSPEKSRLSMEVGQVASESTENSAVLPNEERDDRESGREFPVTDTPFEHHANGAQVNAELSKNDKAEAVESAIHKQIAEKGAHAVVTELLNDTNGTDYGALLDQALTAHEVHNQDDKQVLT